MVVMITRNSAKCISCGVEIESVNRHDFVWHKCDKEEFFVDGGKDYLRRGGSGMIDTSIYEEDR